VNNQQSLSIFIKIGIALFIFMSFPVAYAETSARAYQCDYYSRDAVEQYKKNLQFDCGFKGLRWSNNKAGQRKWCMSVRKSITDKENNIRKKMLERCFKTKTSLKNKSNHPNIPDRCKDPKGLYTPIKSIYSWYRYKREVRTPVAKGVIKFDFNGDGGLDYIFIEQNKKQNVQLTTCLSDKKNKSYRRKVTRIAFSAKGDSLSSEGYDISIKDKQLQISFSYFEHNAGSSFAEGFYAYNNHKHIFELKDSISNGAGIPMPPDYTQSYPIYIPTPPKTL